MSKPCTVCVDPRVQEIDALLAANRSARSLAIEFGFSPRVLQRHAVSHAARPAPNNPKESPERTLSGGGEGDPLDELVAALRPAAIGGSNPSQAREYRLALFAQSSRSAERPEYNVLADPGFLELAQRILRALDAYPAARLAVADALRDE